MKNSLTEDELIRAVNDRSQIAFALLYDRYASPLCKIISLHVKNRKFTEAILENTFLTIIENLPDYEPKNSGFLLWQATIAKQLALAYVPETIEFPEISPDLERLAFI